MKLFTFVRAGALSLALMGCTTVPTLSGPPERVADRISASAVAYNQAYGRAVADQVLLNVLRARDRMPLFHLSMSGIADNSYVDSSGSTTIGSINLGNGNGGVGSIQGQRLRRTAPQFSLNPIGPGTKGTSRQFTRNTDVEFTHYWDNDWPRDLLLYLMVDAIVVARGPEAGTFHNSSVDLARPCPENRPRCRFRDVVETITREQSPDARPRPCAQRDRLNRCDAEIAIGQVTYELELRALDDIIYYVGSISRLPEEASVMVRPPGVYPLSRTGWESIERTAPLFRIQRASESDGLGEYAAQVSYRGHNYVAGRANDAVCIVDERSSCQELRARGAVDASSSVLSLLTQMVVISQNESAQLAPNNAVVQ